MDWTPTSTNSSGGVNLTAGSYIVGAIKTRQEILIFTDSSIHTMRFSGPPFTYQFEVVNEGLSMISPNAATNAGDMVFFMDRDKFVAEGDVSGDIHITGNSRKIRLDGDLVSYNGFVNKLNYKCFVLKAGGIYPVLNIKGTNVTQLDGFIFNLDGDVDLSDKPNLGKQIKSLLKTPLVNVDGKNYEWTLKRMKIENDAAATELKYLKRRRSDINTLSEEEAGILGLERKLEF